MNKGLRDLAVFALMAPVGLLLWQNNLAVMAILGACFVLMCIFAYTREEIAFYIFVGSFGTLLELIGSSVGIWTYTKPNLHTVPAWIFFMWGFTFMMFHSIYLEIQKTFKQAKQNRKI